MMNCQITKLLNCFLIGSPSGQTYQPEGWLDPESQELKSENPESTGSSIDHSNF